MLFHPNLFVVQNFTSAEMDVHDVLKNVEFYAGHLGTIFIRYDSHLHSYILYLWNLPKCCILLGSFLAVLIRIGIDSKTIGTVGAYVLLYQSCFWFLLFITDIVNDILIRKSLLNLFNATLKVERNLSKFYNSQTYYRRTKLINDVALSCVICYAVLTYIGYSMFGFSELHFNNFLYELPYHLRLWHLTISSLYGIFYLILIKNQFGAITKCSIDLRLTIEFFGQSLDLSESLIIHITWLGTIIKLLMTVEIFSVIAYQPLEAYVFHDSLAYRSWSFPIQIILSGAIALIVLLFCKVVGDVSNAVGAC